MELLASVYLSCKGKKVMDYDKILLELGEVGRWQKRSDFLLWILAMAAGMAANLALFPQPQQDPYGEFRCRTGCDVGEDFNFADWNPEERFPSFDNN